MTEREEFEAAMAELLRTKIYPNSFDVWQAARRTTPDREALVEEIAEAIDHMGEGRRLEEYVAAVREFSNNGEKK
ncbi:hypothetical protein QZM35_22685 [Burkholderia sp. AU45274]|uniref:hypothetical protein n=1 Tax=Burkholderia sp. AU45274 TaxID=3059205 RepID=UPI00264D4917|nr:hypothetical protein [Burkholderia sp. AU45274]MDN7490522.1 hypothetical protein [Burkholderia sp. AU45274]